METKDLWAVGFLRKNKNSLEKKKKKKKTQKNEKIKTKRVIWETWVKNNPGIEQMPVVANNSARTLSLSLSFINPAIKAKSQALMCIVAYSFAFSTTS